MPFIHYSFQNDTINLILIDKIGLAVMYVIIHNVSRVILCLALVGLMLPFHTVPEAEKAVWNITALESVPLAETPDASEEREETEETAEPEKDAVAEETAEPEKSSVAEETAEPEESDEDEADGINAETDELDELSDGAEISSEQIIYEENGFIITYDHADYTIRFSSSSNPYRDGVDENAIRLRGAPWDVEKLSGYTYKINCYVNGSKSAYYYDWRNNLCSPEFFDVIWENNRAVAYVKKGAKGRADLVVCSMFEPDKYRETFRVEGLQAITFIDITDDVVTLEYLRGPKLEKAGAAFTLGESLPAWQKAYYHYYQSTVGESRDVFFIDLNFDGAPEFFDLNIGNGGASIWGGIVYQNGEIVQYCLPTTYIGTFYLLKNKKTGKRIWLLYGGAKDGPDYYDEWTLLDFTNASEVRATEKLSIVVIQDLHFNEDTEIAGVTDTIRIKVDGTALPDTENIIWSSPKMLDGYIDAMWNSLKGYSVIGRHYGGWMGLDGCVSYSAEGYHIDFIPFMIAMGEWKWRMRR